MINSISKLPQIFDYTCTPKSQIRSAYLNEVVTVLDMSETLLKAIKSYNYRAMTVTYALGTFFEKRA